MKAIRFVIPKTGGNSFRHQIDEGATFYDNIHYHPEHQITLIIKGEGTSFIGNHIERFKPGDLFMIGKNVPHVSRCDETYYKPDSELTVYSISLFFKDESFGHQFFEIPEMAHIKRLLSEASKGLRLEGSDKAEVSQLIKDCQNLDGFDRFHTFMSILNIFAQSSGTRTLSTISYNSPSKQTDNERINVVFQYLSKNFKENIELQDVSEVANMTPNSFCRYFKQRTGKPYITFLNEMRIEYAGSLIAGTSDSFGNIAIQCGYNSISYFNRQFKKITKLTPLQYRKKFAHKP